MQIPSIFAGKSENDTVLACQVAEPVDRAASAKRASSQAERRRRLLQDLAQALQKRRHVLSTKVQQQRAPTEANAAFGTEITPKRRVIILVLF